MIRLHDKELARQEAIASRATEAEIKQHWSQAAILWRRIGEISSADLCERILQYLAENNLECLPPKTKSSRQ